MTDAWVGGLLALGGVTLQAVIQSRLASASFRREKVWAYRDGRRTHLEQTYEAAIAVAEAYKWHWLEARRVLRTGTGGTEKRAVPWARLQTRVALYVPELRELLFGMEKAGEQLMDASIVLLLNPSADSVPELDATYDRFDTAFRFFEGGLHAEGDKLSADTRRAIGLPEKAPRSAITPP